MANKVELNCEICGKSFSRSKREHKRNQKREEKFIAPEVAQERVI